MPASPVPRRVFSEVEQEGVTITAVVPALAGRWLGFAERARRRSVASLRVLQVGGGGGREIARQMRPDLADVQQVFGMAEGLLMYTRLDDPDEAIAPPWAGP